MVLNNSYLDILKNITTFIFDIDGVLSDGKVTTLPSGEQLRNLDNKDRFGLQMAKEKGYNIAVISGGKSESVRIRLKELGIYDVYLGVADKVDIFKEYCMTYEINPENVLYMGDDLPDYGVMNLVALPACPANAAREILEISKFISSKNGGDGCVREAIEMVMRVKGSWFNSISNETN